MDLVAVTNQHTPADIYPAVRRCIDSGNYDRAAMLFAVAGVYGRFDMQRVQDKTAHQAIDVLQLNTLGSVSEDQHAKLLTALKQRSVPSSAEHAEVCAFLKSLGPPEYYPAYMIQHGIDAFAKKQGGGIVKDFNPSKAWVSSLDSYVHCD